MNRFLSISRLNFQFHSRNPYARKSLRRVCTILPTGLKLSGLFPFTFDDTNTNSKMVGNFWEIPCLFQNCSKVKQNEQFQELHFQFFPERSFSNRGLIEHCCTQVAKAHKCDMSWRYKLVLRQRWVFCDWRYVSAGVMAPSKGHRYQATNSRDNERKSRKKSKSLRQKIRDVRRLLQQVWHNHSCTVHV